MGPEWFSDCKSNAAGAATRGLRCCESNNRGRLGPPTFVCQLDNSLDKGAGKGDSGRLVLTSLFEHPKLAFREALLSRVYRRFSADVRRYDVMLSRMSAPPATACTTD